VSVEGNRKFHWAKIGMLAWVAALQIESNTKRLVVCFHTTLVKGWARKQKMEFPNFLVLSQSHDGSCIFSTLGGVSTIK
jgi:hypothetical protein